MSSSRLAGLAVGAVWLKPLLCASIFAGGIEGTGLRVPDTKVTGDRV